MLTSLAFVFLAGLATAAACRRLRLPPIIGMLAVGAVLGPSALDLLDGSILSISAELRQMALVIILLKAGLSLDLADLKRVGRPAVLLAFVPASCEIVAYLPKATVQAAIGSVPLAAGLACGELVLAVAVTAILLTAPLGALGMDLLAPRLLGEKRRA